MALRRGSRLVPTLILLVLFAAPLRWTVAQRGSIAPRQSVDSLGRVSLTVPRWSFWLQNTWAAAELTVLLFAGYQIWARRGERRKVEAAAAALAAKAANYQAWTVVNSAQGKGGSGGRIDALQDLNANRISLAGVRLDGAWLAGINLSGATLPSASFQQAVLRGANFENANLQHVDFSGADLTGANLQGAILKNANLAGARLGVADLRGANLAELRGWRQIEVVSYLQIGAVREAPAGFLTWALGSGAVEQDQDAMHRTEEQSYSNVFRTT